MASVAAAATLSMTVPPLMPLPAAATAAGGARAAGLAWRPCTDAALRGFDCATFRVPKHYADAAAGSFDLAVVRLRANGSRAQRVGTLFFNPGGPGESGIDVAPGVASALPRELRASFDFVTWDPRGVGRSAGLGDCADGTYTLPATGTVDWDAVVGAMAASERAANAACAAKHPDVVPYLGTRSTVRDLDGLRAAVGDRRLTYWGTSYGTRIGYVYAHDYPDRVRAMLLSSPVDPNATWSSFSLGSAVSPDTAIGFFFETSPVSERRYQRIIRTLNAAPLTLPSGAVVTRWHVRGEIGGSVMTESSYGNIVAFLQTVDTALHGRGTARTAALRALDRREWPDRFPIRGGATPFIGCTDYPQRLDGAQQADLTRRIRAQAPVFGFAASAIAFYCDGVGIVPDPVPVDFTNTRTPMLIVGSTRDALTLYQWAPDLARTFRNSRVVTYVGTQHTPYLAAGSACVDRYGTEYLLRLTRPALDVTCPNVRRAG